MYLAPLKSFNAEAESDIKLVFLNDCQNRCFISGVLNIRGNEIVVIIADIFNLFDGNSLFMVFKIGYGEGIVFLIIFFM